MTNRERFVLILKREMPNPEWGAEVGVRCGKLSERLLNAFPNLTLRCVDLWEMYPDFERNLMPEKVGRWKKGFEEEQYISEFRERTKRFAPRAVEMQMSSEKGAVAVADGSLDFVYVDANHLYEYVRDDISYWLSKVRPGGIIAGDDYNSNPIAHPNFGVTEAVDEKFPNANIEGNVWWVRI